MEHQSRFDPSRKTVGAMYRDLQINERPGYISVDDMTKEMMKGLVDDINDTAGSNPFEGRPFYITVHEKRDLQMKNAFLRRLIKTEYRPYPEDDTTVFWVGPHGSTVLFCWCLPHWSEMDNILNSKDLFDKDLVAQVRAWKSENLYHFGFTKDEMGNWTANPHWNDKPLQEPQIKLIRLSA